MNRILGGHWRGYSVIVVNPMKVNKKVLMIGKLKKRRKTLSVVSFLRYTNLLSDQASIKCEMTKTIIVNQNVFNRIMLGEFN